MTLVEFARAICLTVVSFILGGIACLILDARELDSLRTTAAVDWCQYQMTTAPLSFEYPCDWDVAEENAELKGVSPRVAVFTVSPPQGELNVDTKGTLNQIVGRIYRTESPDFQSVVLDKFFGFTDLTVRYELYKGYSPQGMFSNFGVDTTKGFYDGGIIINNYIGHLQFTSPSGPREIYYAEVFVHLFKSLQNLNS